MINRRRFVWPRHMDGIAHKSGSQDCKRNQQRGGRAKEVRVGGGNDKIFAGI